MSKPKEQPNPEIVLMPDGYPVKNFTPTQTAVVRPLLTAFIKQYPIYRDHWAWQVFGQPDIPVRQVPAYLLHRAQHSLNGHLTSIHQTLFWTPWYIHNQPLFKGVSLNRYVLRRKNDFLLEEKAAVQQAVQTSDLLQRYKMDEDSNRKPLSHEDEQRLLLAVQSAQHAYNHLTHSIPNLSNLPLLDEYARYIIGNFNKTALITYSINTLQRGNPFLSLFYPSKRR